MKDWTLGLHGDNNAVKEFYALSSSTRVLMG
jgi:hypothetical protein